MDNGQIFSGFPQTGLAFLADLATHNEKVWFESHKDVYQSTVLEPAQAFVVALGAKLQTLSRDIQVDTRTDGTGVLMRMYRDTRFSRDKTPYKTNISGLFWRGAQKKTESPAFGFQVDTTGMGLMAGIFKFPPAMLSAYRAAVIDDHLGAELDNALDALHEAGIYNIEGEHYKRVPAGFDPHHKRAHLLRYDGLYVLSPRIPMNDLLTPALVDICYAHFQHMAPIKQWLWKIADRTN